MRKIIILISAVAIVVTSFAFMGHKKHYIHDDGVHCYDSGASRSADHQSRIATLQAGGWTITSDDVYSMPGYEGSTIYCFHMYYQYVPH